MPSKVPFWKTPPKSECALVKRMKRVLSSKKRWTKGVPARDSTSVPVESTDLSAVRFCLHGALCRACANSGDNLFYTIENKMEQVLGGVSVAQFNDEDCRTFDDIKEFLNKLEKRVCSTKG